MLGLIYTYVELAVSTYVPKLKDEFLLSIFTSVRDGNELDLNFN